MMSDSWDYTLDDPIWDLLLKDRLTPYIPYVKQWWERIDLLSPSDTGVYSFEEGWEKGTLSPPGLFYRFTRTAVRSPIRGVQAFPFLIAGYLQLTGVRGGSTKLIQKLCMNGRFRIDGIVCVEIHNLPSTFNQGQLIAFIPEDIYEDVTNLGKWLYFTNAEISMLIQRKVSDEMYDKAVLKG